MKYILILLLALITLQVNAQTKIIGSTTTAGGDLEGTYPNPRIKQNIINRANLTQGLRDSLTRFRKDTLIKKSTDGTLNLASLGNTLGRYNRVHVLVLGETGFNQNVIMPSGADTIRNTEFNITFIAEDTSSTCQIAAFDGFAVYYVAPNVSTDVVVRSLNAGSTVSLKSAYVAGLWTWLSAVSKNIYGTFFEDATGITALTTDVVASGTGSVAATIQPNAVTSAKILNSTIVSADIASQTVDSLDLKNRSITTVKLEDGAVTSLKVLDNSLTGSDLTYLTLRAGTTGSASLQLTSGSDKTTLTGGEILYNGSRFAVGIGANKRRVAVTNDVTPTNGQVPVGNGTDFTTAALTAGYAQTVTNGSGSITILPDTTLVIPYIPSGEISNGTRDGYFKTSTSFGHQYYNGGFRIFNASVASTSAATGLSVSDLANTYRSSIQAAITSANVPTFTITAVGAERGDKGYTFEEKGATIPVLYNSIGANSQAVATYQIDGETSIEYITNDTPTNVTLPEIVGTSLVANKVGVGYTMWIAVNSSVGKNINAAGSDVIIRHGSTSTVTTFTTTGGTYYLKKFVALGLDVWGEF